MKPKPAAASRPRQDKPAYLPFAAHKSGGADQLDGVTQRRLHPDARQDSVSLFTHLHILLLTAESKPNPFSLLLYRFNRDSQRRISPNLQDLSCLFLGVRRGGDDEQAIQQIDGDAVGALIVGATDAEQSPAVNITVLTDRNYFMTSHIPKTRSSRTAGTVQSPEPTLGLFIWPLTGPQRSERQKSTE